MNKGESGPLLVHIDRRGIARPVSEFKDSVFAYGVPSPDGRHIAIVATARSDNVWLMENF